MYKKCGICIATMILTMFLLSGCDSSPDRSKEAPATPVAPVTSAPPEATPAPQQSSEASPTVSAPASQAAKTAPTGAHTASEEAQFINYSCESGKTLAAAYSNEGNWAIVRYQDKQYKMVIAISASGARYTAEGMEWWTKGSSGRLTKLGDGQDDELLESCVQVE